MSKKWSIEEKMSIVMEMLKKDKPVTQICKEYGVKYGMAYKWRDAALSGMQSSLTHSRKSSQSSSEAEKERLLKIIGQQAVIIDYQKKISQGL